MWESGACEGRVQRSSGNRASLVQRRTKVSCVALWERTTPPPPLAARSTSGSFSAASVSRVFSQRQDVLSASQSLHASGTRRDTKLCPVITAYSGKVEQNVDYDTRHPVQSLAVLLRTRLDYPAGKRQTNKQRPQINKDNSSVSVRIKSTPETSFSLSCRFCLTSRTRVYIASRLGNWKNLIAEFRS